MTTQPDLRTTIEAVAGRVGKLFYKHGFVGPSYHAWAPIGEFVMPAPPGNKDESAALTRAIFELHGVTRFVHFDEAWMLDRKANITREAIAQLAKTGLRNHPDRIEVIMYHAEDQVAGVLMAMQRIIRGKGKAKLGPLEFLPIRGGMEGRMVGMLPRAQGTMTQ